MASRWLPCWLLIVGCTARLALAAGPTYTPEQADRLIADQCAPVVEDELLSRIGPEIVGYLSNPETMTFRFRRIDDDRPYSIGLPDGSIYLTRGLLAAVESDADRVAFFCASEADRIADGEALRVQHVADLLATVEPGGALPARLLGALDGCLSPERLFRSDKTAMLALARAGIPPLEGVRALEAAARAGAQSLHFTPTPIAGGTLLDRKVAAAQAAADLIKGATAFDFAVMDISEGKYADGAARFEQFLQLFPANYAGWNNLGLCYYHLAIEKLGTRAFLLADVIAQWDTSFVSRRVGGIVRSFWEKAKAAYDRAIAIDPDRIEAHTNLGNLYSVDNETELAKAEYDRALAIQPGHAITLCNLGATLALAAGETFPPEALRCFEAAVAANPTLPEAQFNLGAALAELGQDGSEAAFRRYLALAPDGPGQQRARLALGERPGRGPRDGTQPVSAPAGAAESSLELWNRVQLALATRDRDLVALLAETPDQQQPAPGRDVNMWGWSRQGLVVELVGGRVNRVMAGRPPGHEAQTQRGVEVGLTVAEVEAKYGPPPAVSRQNPYDIWLYPQVGVGFFLIGDRVNKIFLFQAVEGA